MELGSILQTTTLISAVLSVLLILLQQRGASLGAGFGAVSAINNGGFHLGGRDDREDRTLFGGE